MICLVIVYMWIAPICHVPVDAIILFKETKFPKPNGKMSKSKHERERGETIYQKAISNLTRASNEPTNLRVREREEDRPTDSGKKRGA